MAEPDEAALDGWMSRVSQGDRDAFDPLFAALYPRALRLARTRLDAADAADAAQVILMKMFSRASEFEAGRPVLPWFYAIAANELHTVNRRLAARRVRHAAVDHAVRTPAAGDPERSLLDQELRSCVARAIDALDDDSAEAIRCLLDGEAPPHLSSAAFRKRVSRAYARLRLLLGGLHAR